MSIQDSHRLKQLQSRRAKLEVELEQVGQELTRVQEKHATVTQDLSNVLGQINSLTTTAPVVSEHALLRYLERVQGIDLDEVRSRILSERTIGVINTLDTCPRLPIGEGVALVVENRRVVSVIGDHGKRQSKKGKRKGSRQMTPEQELRDEIAYAQEQRAEVTAA